MYSLIPTGKPVGFLATDFMTPYPRIKGKVLSRCGVIPLALAMGIYLRRITYTVGHTEIHAWGNRVRKNLKYLFNICKGLLKIDKTT